MRNLKRALSLAVASVMLVGMMVVGTGASYADVTSEENQEAIEVLQAVGIMTGDDEGNFNPDQNVTRNEMAVIMCNLMDYTVSSYAGTAPFTDVPSWAEPYVAACWTHSITGGTSATTYGGDESVTTSQAALMLMKALGYFQYQSDFGSDWQVATVSKGSQIGIFDDIDTAAAEALTRNDVAQMVLNALEKNMVDATGDGGTTITGEGFEITTGKATYEDRTSSDKKYGKIDDERSTNNGRYIIQLGEDLFDGDLECADKTDDFGRPGTKWTYKGTDIGTYAEAADDTMVINKTLDAKQIVCTDSDYFDYNEDDVAAKVSVYINGDKVADAVSYATLDKAKLYAGDVVELYENDDNEIETVAVIRYTLAQIDEIETSLSSTYTNRGATCSIELKNLNDGSVGAGTYYDKYSSDSNKELPGFAASTYTEGTVLAVALRTSDNAILTSHVATEASGKVTAYNSGSKANITLDSSDYALHAVVDTTSGTKYANSAAETAASGSGLLDFNYDDSTYAIYTDANGYVIGIDETESVKLEDVYYVTGLGGENGAYSKNVYAQAVSLTDGSVTEFKLKTSDSDTAKAFGLSDFSGVGGGTIKNDGSIKGLYTFDKDGSNYTAEKYVGKISGTAASYQSTDSTNYVFAASTGVPAAISDDLARDDTSLKLTGVSGRYYLTDSTNYLKVEDDGDDIDVKFVTGGTSTKKDGVTAIVVATKSNNNYVANYVVLVSDKFSNAGSDDVVFVHEQSSTAASYTDADGKTQTGYKTELWFLDGSGNVETVTTDKRYAAGFYTWEINDDDVYELTDDVEALNAQFGTPSKNVNYDDETGHVGFVPSGNDFAKDSGAVLTGIYSGSLTIDPIKANGGGKNINLEDVPFAANVIIGDDRGKSDRDKDLYTSEITTVSQLKTAIDKDNSNVKAVLYYDDGEVIMVYVLSMADAKSDGSSGGEIDDSVTSVTLKSDKTITVTLADNISTKKTVQVELQLWNSATAEYKTIQTVSVEIDGTSGATNTGNSGTLSAIATGSMYKAVYGSIESDPVSF